MCTLSRRYMHAGIGENGRQPIDPSALFWDELRRPVRAIGDNRQDRAPPAVADPRDGPATTDGAGFAPARAERNRAA